MINTDESYDILLDVPYYCQNDPNNGLEPFWRERSCGVHSLKMVLDYWRAKEGKEPIPVKELFDHAYAIAGVNDNYDWAHSSFTKTAHDYGFIAWRRMWSLSADQRKAAAASDVTDESLERNEAQQRLESLPTLVDALDHGKPVIVSVAKNFDEVARSHLIVLTGIRRKQKLGAYEGFFYNDPFSPIDHFAKERYVTIDVFRDKWNYLAIFIEPKAE